MVAEGFVPTLANTVKMTGTKFIMIIDEWDAPIREEKANFQIQRDYLDFLRTLFKNSGATVNLLPIGRKHQLQRT